MLAGDVLQQAALLTTLSPLLLRNKSLPVRLSALTATSTPASSSSCLHFSLAFVALLQFARMATDAYAVEAMAYMTTALIDGPKLDMSVEAAMVKVST